MICMTIILINLTSLNWSGRDLNSLSTAQDTCKREYNLCLKKFIKKEKNNFHAICGESNGKRININDGSDWVR